MSLENITALFVKRVSDANNSSWSPGDGSSDNSNKNDSLISEQHMFGSLTEHEAGITEYLSNEDGFKAVIKERFSDFQVHEIDLEGNIVKLTNFDIPIVVEPTLNESDDVLDNDIWEQLKGLQEKQVDSVEIDVSDYDKDRRRKIHTIIKRKYGKLFTTNTTVNGTDNVKKLIVVTQNKGNRDMWPSSCGKYLHFVLFKVNIDTMDAINVIATKLSTKVSNFTYAGTKDKRGKTSQQVSMWHLKAERLNSLNKCLKNVKVGNFSYKNSQLRLGDLKGNHFKVALRNVTADDCVVNSALKSLQEKGFINYFGLQRFGSSPEIPTFKIGKSLIKGEFKDAVDLILKPRVEKVHKDGLEEARKIWWEKRDAKKAYSALKSKNKTNEGKLLLGLSQLGNNAYVNALDKLPRNVRLLYLHSYQSLLWNKILSKRIREFGCKILEGDLVWNKNEELQIGVENESITQDVSKGKSCVKCITGEEIQEYKIFDVVHPLPGFNVIYPNNLIGIWYEELLKEEGLTSDEFKQNMKKYSLSGTYRNIVKKVNDLSWEIMFYSRPEDDLILSDIDIIDKSYSNLTSNTDGKYKAVVMNFSLDSSTYATMALREVLKIDISSSYQASLNSYSNKRKCKTENEPENKRIKI